MTVGLLPIVDLGPTGFSASAGPDLVFPPGTVLDSLELLRDGDPVWSGRAVVVHRDEHRFGARFTSELLDLACFKVRATMEHRLALRRRQNENLPAVWRAAVDDVRHLLEDARVEIDELERSMPDDPLHRAEDEEAVFESLHERWGAAYYDAITQLHELSKALPDESVALARSYASSALLPLLLNCPMQRRAYEKPLGYAGDYRLMELYFGRELSGDGMFGRFLYSVGQRYSLARTVVTREVAVRHAVNTALRGRQRRAVRVLSVGSGPAIEIRNLLGDVTSLPRPLELILLDQDATAHETTHRRLMRILVEKHEGRLPVTLEYLHFSVRQLIKPWTLEEVAVRDVRLANLDLVYSAGLYDYLTDIVASRLTQVLYSRLRPGGRLLIANLMETPDSTWIMEYVLDWHLIYRTEETLRRLADDLHPTPARVTIERDATGRCLFLDVRSPR